MEKEDNLQLVVAHVAEMRRDIWRNLPFLIGIIVVTILYVLVSSYVVRIFECGWTFWHACYFTVINMTTVGFGDVLPLTHGGKIIAGINAVAGLVLFGALVAVFTLAFQPSGWTTSLQKSKVETMPDGTEPHAISRRSASVENGLAEMLDGLAKTLRAINAQDKVTLREGAVKVRVIASGKAPHFVEIYIDVRPR